MAPPVILFDYDTSPFGQKVRLALSAAGIPFQRCLQPMLLPRPILEELGITHRRIPILAIGKDVYCDSASIIDTLHLLSDKLPRTPADKAFEAFSLTILESLKRGFFGLSELPALIQDRATIFPVFSRPDYATLCPSGASDFRSSLEIIEHDFLNGKPFITGEALTVADINVMWIVRWGLRDLGYSKRKGFTEQDLPGVYAWIDRVPITDVDEITAKEAAERIFSSEYFVKEHQLYPAESLDIPIGTETVVETEDSKPGSHPQIGVLVGTTVHEVVIEILNGMRLHFPKRGYIIRSKAVCA